MGIPELQSDNQGDNTTIITKDKSGKTLSITGESTILGTSIRGWVVVILCATVCTMALMEKSVEEPLYSGFMICLGYYFGQKTDKPSVGKV